jgi:hypothetical protein
LNYFQFIFTNSAFWGFFAEFLPIHLENQFPGLSIAGAGYCFQNFGRPAGESARGGGGAFIK